MYIPDVVVHGFVWLLIACAAAALLTLLTLLINGALVTLTKWRNIWHFFRIASWLIIKRDAAKYDIQHHWESITHDLREDHKLRPGTEAMWGLEAMKRQLEETICELENLPKEKQDA